jgi:hypothetical protein
MTFTFRNRPVGNFEVDDVDTRDYPGLQRCIHQLRRVARYPHAPQ